MAIALTIFKQTAQLIIKVKFFKHDKRQDVIRNLIFKFNSKIYLENVIIRLTNLCTSKFQSMLRETRRVQMWVQDFLMDDPGIPRISANFVVKYNLLPRTDIAPFKKSHRRCAI